MSTTGVGSQFELTFWQSVESGSDPALYEAYLAQYPNGTFATVARVKLAKLRQLAAPPVSSPPAQPAIPAQPVPVQIAPTPVVTAAAQDPAPATAPRQLATANAQSATPSAAPARERRAGRVPVTRPVTSDAADSAPYITPAPPVEPAPDNADSAALQRLLGALGESQRSGAPPPAPIADAPAAAATASETPAMVPASTPSASPGASPPRLVETTATPPLQPAAAAVGPTIVVPDAAALSASHAPVDDPHPIAVGQLPPGFALPPRPQLAAIPPLAFPASFCSAEARNAFHDGPYINAVDAAKHNNDAAIAYLKLLQDLYNTNQLSGEINPLNAVAAEARAYGPVAAAAFNAQSTLVGAFNTLMAVPIVACDAPKQP